MYKKLSLVLIAILALIMIVITIFKKDIQQEISPNNPTVITSEDGTKTKYIPSSFKQKKNINMLLIGDEIGLGYGGAENKDNNWIQRVKKELESNFGVSIALTDSSSFKNTSFGCWVDFAGDIVKKTKKYDLVVLVAGKSEASYDAEQFASPYEEVIRRVQKAYLGATVVIIAENGISDEQYYTTLSELSQYYGALYVDMRKAFETSGKDMKTLVNWDGYPNSNGYELYAAKTIKAVAEDIYSGKSGKFDFRVALYDSNDDYSDYYRIISYQQILNSSLISDKNNVPLLKNAKIEKSGKRYTNLTMPRDYIETAIKGSMIGLYAEASNNSGKVKVYVDEYFVKEVDLYSPNTVEKKILLDRQNEYGNYNVRLEVSDTKNPQSTGTNVNIFGIISNTKKSDIK